MRRTLSPVLRRLALAAGLVLTSLVCAIVFGTQLGMLTFSAILVIVANLLTDLSYRWIDPRLRGR